MCWGNSELVLIKWPNVSSTVGSKAITAVSIRTVCRGFRTRTIFQAVNIIISEYN